MQKMKRNHWVPQSYLRAFAADGDAREKIWRFGKTDGDPELKPIENVAVQFYLYVPKDADGVRDYSFEKKLADLENWFGDELWQSLGNELMPLDWEPLRQVVSLLAAVMYLRNPVQFENAKELHGILADWIGQMPELPGSFEHKGKTHALDTSRWPEYRDASEDDLKRAWLDTVGSCGWLAKRFMGMRWSVIFADEPVFITSDHPVTVVHPSLDFRGFKNPETRVIFPVSPTRILVMDHQHQEPANQHYPLKDHPGTFNLLVWRHAIEYMFSHRHTDLVCAEMDEWAKTESVGC